MNLDFIKTSSGKVIMATLRYHPEMVDILKNNLSEFILLSGEESNSELVFLFKNGLREKPLCECGKSLCFIKLDKGYKITCGDKYCVDLISNIKRSKTCITKFGGKAPVSSKEVRDKIKSTMIERYGVDSSYKIPGIKEKIINTNKERYGTEWSSQNDGIKKKMMNTVMENYGVDCTLKNSEISKKSKASNIKKYGVDSNLKNREEKLKIENIIREKYNGWPTQNQEIKDKIKNTVLSRYGVSHISQTDMVKEKISKSRKRKFEETMDNVGGFKGIDKNGHYIFESLINKENYSLSSTLFYRRKRNGVELDTFINPLKTPIKENELYSFIKQIYNGEIIKSDYKILDGKELDIYLPDINLAIEFDGLYWHCELYKDKTYHLDKTKKCLEKNITLIHIFEDEWDHKENIVKSIIKNKLGLSQKVYARKCYIKIVDNKTSKLFLQENHIQGSCYAKISLGLYYNDELISLMTFGNERISMGKHKKIDHYEMIRFCNKLNYSVIGGANKLLSFFIKNYNPRHIISYADMRLFDGGLYETLGFKFDHESKPNYWYIIGNKREYRFKYRKDILVKQNFDSNKSEREIMRERGIYRIYDCGNKKYSLSL